MSTEDIQKIIINTLLKYHVKRVALFGSYARNEQNSGSDIDIMVDFDKDKLPSLFGLVGIENELEDKLGVRVDMVTWGHINKYVWPYVKKDLKIIYE